MKTTLLLASVVSFVSVASISTVAGAVENQFSRGPLGGKYGQELTQKQVAVSKKLPPLAERAAKNFGLRGAPRGKPSAMQYIKDVTADDRVVPGTRTTFWYGGSNTVSTAARVTKTGKVKSVDYLDGAHVDGIYIPGAVAWLATNMRTGRPSFEEKIPGDHARRIRFDDGTSIEFEGEGGGHIRKVSIDGVGDIPIAVAVAGAKGNHGRVTKVVMGVPSSGETIYVYKDGSEAHFNPIDAKRVSIDVKP